MSETTKIDHVGLTVSDLKKSVDFFIGALGWTVFGGNEAYPATYVTDGLAKITLWQVKNANPNMFDRHANIGLHHLALAVATEEKLELLFTGISKWPDVVVEFSPELSGKGPKKHFMIREPGGCRFEFCFDPR